MDNLIAIITGVTALIVAVSTCIKNLVEAKKNLMPSKIEEQSTTNMQIINLLEEAKERFRADRIQVYDYQNGEHFINGRSAYKVSCTYESVRTGVKSYQLQLQRIPLLCIPKFHYKLLNCHHFYVKDIEEIKDEMPSTYELKKSQGVKAFYDIPLKNKNEEPIGFIGIQYNDNYYELTKEDEKEIELFKKEIEKELEKMVPKS